MQNRRAWWKDVLKKYDRIAVVGGPRAGKTTLTRIADRPVIHTDDYMKRAWDAAPYAAIADVIDLTHDQERPRFIIEGTRAVSCLRRGLKVDAVCVLMEPLQELTPRQEGMRKAVMTKLAEWFKDHKNVAILQAPPVTDLDKDEADE